MVLLLLGCSFGLSAYPRFDTGTFALPGDEATSVSVADQVYAIAPGNLAITEPPGLGAVLEQLYDRELLIYVGAVGDGTMSLAGALAAADGSQDPCERVVWFPLATWDNPWFGAGPEDWTATVGGAALTFQDFHLSGRFEADGRTWTAGRLDTVLDARQVDPALPEGLSSCELVSAAGGACEPCPDGYVSCVRLTVEIAEATVQEMSFDPGAVGCG